jgi:hypothetical protein
MSIFFIHSAHVWYKNKFGSSVHLLLVLLFRYCKNSPLRKEVYQLVKNIAKICKITILILYKVTSIKKISNSFMSLYKSLFVLLLGTSPLC